MGISFLGVDWAWLISTILIYVIGFGFDRAFFFIKKNGYKKNYMLWSWLAHDAAVVGEIYSYALFCMSNPTLPFLFPLGVILWVIGTIIIGYYQHLDNPKLPVFYYGDGLGNTPEYLMNQTTNLYNYIFKQKMTMATMSAFVRIGLMVIAVIGYLIHIL